MESLLIQEGMTGNEAIAFCKRCPKFVTCSVNICPLDRLNTERTFCAFDPERTCKLHLRDRLAIVEKAKAEGIEIPGGGFTRNEQNALDKGRTLDELLAEWDALVERQSKRGARGSQYLAQARAAKALKDASGGCRDAEEGPGTTPTTSLP